MGALSGSGWCVGSFATPPLPLKGPSAWSPAALLTAADVRTLPGQPVRSLKTVSELNMTNDTSKPLLMVDIDGVISLFGA